MTLQDINTAARVREAVTKIATETLEVERPRSRYATVMSIDKVSRTVTVKYPDEAATFVVRCGSVIPLSTGQVVRVSGQIGDRYVDDVIGDASFDGDPISGGGGGSTRYQYNQTTPSAQWAISHTLGGYPLVSVVDSAGTQIWGDVTYPSTSQVVVTFTAAFTGTASLI